MWDSDQPDNFDNNEPCTGFADSGTKLNDIRCSVTYPVACEAALPGHCTPWCPATGCGMSDGCGGTCGCSPGLVCLDDNTCGEFVCPPQYTAHYVGDGSGGEAVCLYTTTTVTDAATGATLCSDADGGHLLTTRTVAKWDWLSSHPEYVPGIALWLGLEWDAVAPGVADALSWKYVLAQLTNPRRIDC